MQALINSITAAVSFIWGLFGDVLDIILDPNNVILLYVTLVPIVIGVMYAVFKVLKKFGVR